jgi:hypothetical protein
LISDTLFSQSEEVKGHKKKPTKGGLSYYKAIAGLNQRYFHSVRAFFALGYFELNFVVFANRAYLQVADVNENVFASFVVFDETKAFGLIKEFYRSGGHGGWLWSFPKLLGHRGLVS